ncbi:TIGR02611 family protein [Streptomyces sp. Z26]|uniref:TIGR02611 family protein n=1 Tax=Streptomyces phytohabitans TaxID=1150371 RepID=UPI000EF1303C|nr:TIGR02611 family protein [Streptomyces sp. Z26]
MPQQTSAPVRTAAPHPVEPARDPVPGPAPEPAPAAAVTVSATVPADRPLGSRAPACVRRSRALHLCWQTGVFLAGLVVVVVGVVLLPLPGPGWVVIFAGMALWATEFVWAQLVLRWTRRRVTEAARRALDPRVRRRNLALTGAAAALCVALLSAYLRQYGLVLPWAVDR